MDQIHYCKSWFSAKKRPLQVWDEAKARQAHEDRKNYTVLIGELERPTHVVLISNKFVAVDFMDDNLREALSYHFKEYEPGRLFLSMAVYREFYGESDNVTGGTAYTFKRDGAVIIRRETFTPHHLDVDEHLIEEAERVVDVAGNYDRYPAFGAYDRVCIAERPTPEYVADRVLGSEH
ncbi:MAG: hypothetical protein ACR2PO_20235 [Methyloligellaceae bacterium]